MTWEWLVFSLIPVLGHVLYGIPPDPEDSEEARITLHNGDGFSSGDESPNPGRLLRLRAVSADGETPLTADGAQDSGVTVDVSAVRSRPCWVVMETPPTFIELPAQKFHGYLEHEGLSEVIAGRKAAGRDQEPGRENYSKYVKIALADRDGGLRLRAEPVGLPIEIAPLFDAQPTLGASLPVCVLVGGRPAGGLQLRVSHRESEQAEPSGDSVFRTDQDGRAEIPIDRPGLWRLHTIAMCAAEGGDADWESLWACLTFRL